MTEHDDATETTPEQAAAAGNLLIGELVALNELHSQADNILANPKKGAAVDAIERIALGMVTAVSALGQGTKHVSSFLLHCNKEGAPQKAKHAASVLKIAASVAEISECLGELSGILLSKRTLAMVGLLEEAENAGFDMNSMRVFVERADGSHIIEAAELLGVDTDRVEVCGSGDGVVCVGVKKQKGASDDDGVCDTKECAH